MSNRLALGTVQFGLAYGISNSSGQVPRSEIQQMLQLAKRSGIDTLDTAIAYGSSESELGQTDLSGFQVVTKLPEIPAGIDIPKWVLAQVQGSLQRLQKTSVYGVLLHRPEQLKGHQGRDILSGLAMLKQLGLAQKVGASIYAPEDLDGIPLHGIDLVQAPYNLIDQRLYTTGLANRLIDVGVELHTRSVFLQGLLLMSEEARPEKFRPWTPMWSRWHGWLHSENISAVHACLSFVLSQTGISRVVVGAQNQLQLEEMLGVMTQTTPSKWPDMRSADTALVNPSHWTKL